MHIDSTNWFAIGQLAQSYRWSSTNVRAMMSLEQMNSASRHDQDDVGQFEPAAALIRVYFNYKIPSLITPQIWSFCLTYRFSSNRAMQHSHGKMVSSAVVFLLSRVNFAPSVATFVRHEPEPSPNPMSSSSIYQYICLSREHLVYRVLS